MRTANIEADGTKVVVCAATYGTGVTRVQHLAMLTEAHPALKGVGLPLDGEINAEAIKSIVANPVGWALMAKAQEFVTVSPHIRTADGAFSAADGEFTADNLLKAFKSYLDTDPGEPDSLWVKIGAAVADFAPKKVDDPNGPGDTQRPPEN